jgi:flagellar hook-associated protein 1
MGLSSALDSALSGLTTTQAQIDVISQNVSNQGSVGYTRRQATLVQQVTGGQTTGVQVARIQRILDQVVVSQLRNETSTGAYTRVQSANFAQLDQLFGQPGGVGALDTTLNKFTSASQALANDPSNTITRNGFVAAAQALAGQLGTISNGIQQQRDGIEAHLADDVQIVNGILRNLQDLNGKIIGLSDSQTSAALLDQRDAQISELAKYVDISISTSQNNGVRITTTGGLPLLDNIASQFKYDQHYVLNATSQYSNDANARGVGTISLVGANGSVTDVLSNSSIRSGEIAGLVNLRDNQLVQAQTQIDQLAAGLSNAVANNQVVGAPVANGFNADFAATPIQKGNAITIKYLSGGVTKSLTIKRVDDSTITPPNALNAQQLAEQNESTLNNRVIALDFSGGVAGALADLAAKILGGTEAPLPAGIILTNPAGSQLQAISSTPAFLTINSVKGSITTTALTLQGTALPLFIDSQTGAAFTGSYEGSVDQLVGLSQRLVVNPAIISNPASLIVFQANGLTPATLAGDPQRAQFIYDQLTSANQAFSPLGGIGSNGAPFDGTVTDFATNVVQNLSGRSVNAKNIDEGQQIVLKSVQATFASESGVKIDQELANLIEVQNAYSANARLISTVKDLYDVLLKI